MKISAVRFAIAIGMAAFIGRMFCFFTIYGNLRHGAAEPYGSAALGLLEGKGLTVQVSERTYIENLPNNYSGDYRTAFVEEGRQPFVEFLPGPVWLLCLLWKIIPIYNFGPYLILQALIDSVLIALFFAVFCHYHRTIALVTALFMIVDLPEIKRILMMGYDFWPQYGVMVVVTGLLWALRKERHVLTYCTLGILVAIPVWCREIAAFLPIISGVALFFLLHMYYRLSISQALQRSFAFMVPVLVAFLLLSWYRYETTGDMRPTRSTFWHTFFVGIGQFENPYGVSGTDDAVWELGKKMKPELAAYTMEQMGRTPDSPYESLLRDEAKSLIRNHPWLIARNTLYRVGIMISPLLYSDGDMVPARLGKLLLPVGLILIPIWLAGLRLLYRRFPHLFWLFASIYLYFFASFGWFYVVGRVILPYLFVSVCVCCFGILLIIEKVNAGRSERLRSVSPM